jgi:hypothetical protein
MRARGAARWLAVFLLFGLAAACASSNALAAAKGATVTFRKIFKNSTPEFVEIKVDEAGSGTYDIRQLSDDANPEAFQVGEALARRILDLSAKLRNFDGVNLESRHRIANLGDKTFRYDNGAESHMVTFNYTVDETAVQLLDAFEGLSRQLGDASDLQHALRYDRLGVNDAILQVEKDLDAKLLPEPERLLPLLQQVSADQRVIEMARRRANSLAARIQNPR